jgi:inosine-uridine nucleoside N-ribohydrolase
MGAAGSNPEDALALVYLLSEPDVAVELVTTGNGNADLDGATTLTLDVLHRMGSPGHGGLTGHPMIFADTIVGGRKAFPDMAAPRPPRMGICPHG